MMPVTDEELMQHADGLLQGERAAAVARAIADDPALAMKHRQLTRAREEVRQAAAAQVLPPAPQAMIDRIRALQAGAAPRREIGAAEGADTLAGASDATRPVAASLTGLDASDNNAPATVQVGSTVTPFRPRRSILAPAWSGALAAGLVIGAVGLGAGYMLGQRSGSELAGGDILGQPGLAAALDTLESGSELALPSGAMVQAVASFKDDQGHLCREIAINVGDAKGLVAVTCDKGTGWETQLAITTSTGEDAYVPASALETLDAWISATGAGAPLSAEAEAAALSTRQSD